MHSGFDAKKDVETIKSLYKEQYDKDCKWSAGYIYSHSNGVDALALTVRYNWQQYLPGNDSALIWREQLGFSQLPQVINPDSGFVFSAKQTPFNVTSGDDNPKENAFAPGHGFQMEMTNRAHRGLELFAELGPTISAEEFFAIKHDKAYAPATYYMAYLQKISDQNFTDPVLQQAQQIIADWDLATDVANTSAALGTCVLLAAESDDDRDQALDYANEVLHAPLFDEQALQQNLSRAYRPGDELLDPAN